MIHNAHAFEKYPSETSYLTYGGLSTVPEQSEPSENAHLDSSGESDATFSTAVDLLINETHRLDYELRYVGSGGPGMVYASAFRNVLRRLTKLFADYPDYARQDVVQTLRDLDLACYGLRHALLDFIGIAYNRNLISSLYRLSRILRKYYKKAATSHESIRSDLAGNIISVKEHLEKFIDKDIRTIKSVQKDEAESYTNLTVIATFLSGVTASMIQIVGPATSEDSTLATAVNASLFSSLVFSTASAMQSLLAIMWMKSFVRLPERSLHHLVYAWLHRGPIISLLAAGALFAVGLVLYIYSSNQHAITSVITTCVATVQTIGLLGLTILFIRDRWKFRREGGKTGLKLTKSSVLFSAMEGMEKFLTRYPSESKQEDDKFDPTTYIDPAFLAGGLHAGKGDLGPLGENTGRVRFQEGLVPPKTSPRSNFESRNPNSSPSQGYSYVSAADVELNRRGSGKSETLPTPVLHGVNGQRPLAPPPASILKPFDGRYGSKPAPMPMVNGRQGQRPPIFNSSELGTDRTSDTNYDSFDPTAYIDPAFLVSDLHVGDGILGTSGENTGRVRFKEGVVSPKTGLETNIPGSGTYVPGSMGGESSYSQWSATDVELNRRGSRKPDTPPTPMLPGANRQRPLAQPPAPILKPFDGRYDSTMPAQMPMDNGGQGQGPPLGYMYRPRDKPLSSSLDNAYASAQGHGPAFLSGTNQPGWNGGAQRSWA